MEHEVESLPEEERTDVEKNKIFSKTMGIDARGRVRCMGKGPSSTTMRDLALAQIEDRVQQVRDEVRQQVTNVFEELLAREREARAREREELIALIKREKDDMEKIKGEVNAIVSKIEPNNCNIFMSNVHPHCASNSSPGVGSTSMRAKEISNDYVVAADLEPIRQQSPRQGDPPLPK